MSAPAIAAPSGALPSRGLPPGTRGRLDVGPLDTETGGHLPEVTLAYETWGTLDPDGSNAVLVLHALTGGPHVAAHSADPQPGWWEDLVGPGRPVDTDRWFVVAPDMLGGCHGSTGPGSLAPDGAPWGSRFPFLTLRDAVEAERRLADRLGIGRWHAVIGGSMGGARALEWAVTHPERVAGLGVLASTAQSSADQIAWGQAQTAAIRLDPDFAGGDYAPGTGPRAGLALARRIAHTTYRTAAELEGRFGRHAQQGEDPFGAVSGPAGGAGGGAGTGAGIGSARGRYAVESYLDHQGAKLVERFDANSYLVLTEALMSHDVARGRGSLAAALARFEGRAFVAAVDSDRLYRPEEAARLAALLPGRVPVHTIHSPVGHDGFLTDHGQVADALTAALVL